MRIKPEPQRRADPMPPLHGPGGGDAPRQVTPGLIVSCLSTGRLAEVAGQYGASVHDLAASHEPGHAARRLLKLLTTEELRAVAMRAGVPTDGHFIDLWRRLSLLC